MEERFSGGIFTPRSEYPPGIFCSARLRSALGDREHDLASDMPSGGAFVRRSGLRERKRAVDRDANRARVEQASQFSELRAGRADLSARHRDAQLRGLFGVVDSEEHREQGAAALEGAQEAAAVGAADGVEN